MIGSQRMGRGVLALVVAAVLASPAFPATAVASVPSCSVPSATLMTMTGSVGWSRSPNSCRRVASTIKMLNALVVRDRKVSLDETVAVPAKAVIWDGGVGLVKGQVLTIRQLLNMMLIASANDAAEAVAIHIGGTQKKYVAMMNAEAKKLGLKNTHAIDAHGLSERETSTAADLSVLARHVMADPVLRAIVRKKSVQVPRPHKKAKTVASTNLLMRAGYKGMEGVKTGYTSTAGFCFVGAAKRDGVELLGVVMHAKSLAARFSEMRKLLDWGFAHCHVKTFMSQDTTAGTVAIKGALLGVDVHPETTVTAAVFDSAAPSCTTSITLDTTVSAPVACGQRLGTLQVMAGKVVLVTVPLVACSQVTTEALLPTSTFERLVAQR